MRNWKKINLGDTATFHNGYAFKPKDWKRSGKEIIRIQNLTHSSNKVNYYQGRLPEKYKVIKGDILISWSGSIGVYVWDREDAWLNQHIFKVDFNKEEINKEFFKYLIINSIKKIESQVHGATMKHITKTKFDSLPIFLPPLEEQKRIAAILDAADDYRQKTRALIDKYDELAQSLFLEMFGDPVTNPKGWEKAELGSISHISSGSTPSRKNELYFQGNIPWVKTTEVCGEMIVETSEKISQEAINSSSCKLNPVNSLVIAMYGQGKTRGQVGSLGIEAATNQACAVIPPSDKMNFKFLFEHLKLCYTDLRRLGRGGNQPNLNTGIVKKYKVIAPPLHLQNLFTERRLAVKAQKDTAIKNLEKSDQLFNSLLQAAFKS